MKKLILTTILVGLAAGAYAQGTVSFQNALITPKVYTNDVNGHVGLATKGTFTVALYWGVAGSTEAQLVPIATTVGSAADGVFFQGVVTTPVGTAPGANAVFEVRGWLGNYATYDAAGAAGAFVGSTGLFNNPTGGAGSPPSTAANLTGWTGNLWLIDPALIPEPSTYSILGMGLLGFLWKPLRRRIGHK